MVQNTKHTSPHIHNLTKLATMAEISLSDEQIMDLKIITTFNIAARYENEKFNFYKKCTADYTKKYLDLTKHYYLWLRKNYQKK